MKHFFLVCLTVVLSGSAFAQKAVLLNPVIPIQPQQYTLPRLAPQADDIVLTWLTADDINNAIGLSAAGAFACFMELNTEDIANNGFGKKAVAIKQIQYCLNNPSTCVSACKLVIRQGTTFAGSTVVFTQTGATFANGWNAVDLNTPYTIDATKNIYIGYEITQTTSGGPIGLRTSDEVKQGWVNYGTTFDNFVTSYGYGIAIKAVASAEDAYPNAVSIRTLDMQTYTQINSDIEVKTTVRNIGSQPLTSFTLNYSVNGTSASPYQVTGINIPTGGTGTFTHPEKFKTSEGSIYTFNVSLSAPNGDNAAAVSSKSIAINSYSSIVPRVLLHESFTSSTCGPCAAGNQNLLNVLNAVDESRWANIRYQMNWPSTGDPYFTMEGYQRRTFYDITAVPDLEIDGNKFNGSPYDHSVELFNQLAETPAAANLSAECQLTGKRIDAHISVLPVINKNSENLRLFAAIVEKTTTNNKKSNGESLFHNVMKKFLTSSTGDQIGNFVDGTAQTFGYSWTFQGNYRLPTAAVNSSGQYIGINNETEHSVENFENLIVVYWIQDIETKEVIQSGKATPALNSSVVFETQITPSANATNTTINAPVEVTFNKAFNIVDASKISINGVPTNYSIDENILKINHDNFEYGTTYTVKIESSAIETLIGNVEWQFSTNAANTRQSTTPGASKTNIAVDSMISALYNNPVEILNANLLKVLEIVGTDTAEIAISPTVDGTRLILGHNKLKNNTIYLVRLGAGAIKGVTTSYEWKFKTIASSAIDAVASTVSINPTLTSGDLQVQTANAATVKVLDISGRTLAKYKSSGNLPVRLNYADGIYFIVVDDGNGVTTQKVILKK